MSAPAFPPGSRVTRRPGRVVGGQTGDTAADAYRAVDDDPPPRGTSAAQPASTL